MAAGEDNPIAADTATIVVTDEMVAAAWLAWPGDRSPMRASVRLVLEAAMSAAPEPEPVAWRISGGGLPESFVSPAEVEAGYRSVSKLKAAGFTVDPLYTHSAPWVSQGTER